MIDFPDYNKATNAAYEILKKYNYSFPIIDVYYIYDKYKNIKLCTYTSAAQKMGITHNEFTYQMASSEHGFTVADYANNHFIVFFNNLKDDSTIRFTLMHELGHIILMHSSDNDTSKKEANCFARNILCPVQIVREYKLKSAKEYSECFGISMPMANACIGHFKSDMYYITNELYNAVNDNIYRYMTGYTLPELYGYCV